MILFVSIIFIFIDDILCTYYASLGPTDTQSAPSPSTASMISKSNAMKNHPLALKRLDDLKPMMQVGKDVAIAEKNRQVERGVKRDPNGQGGRGASKPNSKQAPKGFRTIL
ncbi:uncharacterized protein LOC109850258 [Asparagus officinalis]|uniref:uncharacterized protein LOC109850258 n=1 Tax=Asparagus officinalis TaxID=4686 RepID=UPI00098E522D|nr:uncharacterized protein LOC109850258 [Asparagus officinalis]